VAITNIAIPALSRKYFSSSMVVPLSISWCVVRIGFRTLRTARKCRANDLSEDEFFD
jgi:hypothetical protein